MVEVAVGMIVYDANTEMLLEAVEHDVVAAVDTAAAVVAMVVVVEEIGDVMVLFQ
jgi:hypothetical protein